MTIEARCPGRRHARESGTRMNLGHGAPMRMAFSREEGILLSSDPKERRVQYEQLGGELATQGIAATDTLVDMLERAPTLVDRRSMLYAFALNCSIDKLGLAIDSNNDFSPEVQEQIRLQSEIIIRFIKRQLIKRRERAKLSSFNFSK